MKKSLQIFKLSMVITLIIIGVVTIGVNINSFML
ncbi:MAG: hypothetical protein K0R54_522 [Clostridiaceae bacterium]|jgi:hypothetical protein|nr:hypothetical protein [Clostridiaceae bacterium]